MSFLVVLLYSGERRKDLDLDLLLDLMNGILTYLSRHSLYKPSLSFFLLRDLLFNGLALCMYDLRRRLLIIKRTVRSGVSGALKAERTNNIWTVLRQFSITRVHF